MYVRTASGKRAWESPASGLPPHYRTLLGLIARGAPFERMREALAGHPPHQLQGWLDELETLCFVERAAAPVTQPAPRRASGARRG